MNLKENQKLSFSPMFRSDCNLEIYSPSPNFPFFVSHLSGYKLKIKIQKTLKQTNRAKMDSFESSNVSNNEDHQITHITSIDHSQQKVTYAKKQQNRRPPTLTPAQIQLIYFCKVACLPSRIANRTIGFEGLTKEASCSNCSISTRFKFCMFESPSAAISLLVHRAPHSPYRYLF